MVSNVKKLGKEEEKLGVSTKRKQKEDMNGEDDSESANLSKRTKKPLRPKQQQKKDKVSSVKGVEKNDRIESDSVGRKKKKKKKKKDKDLKPKNEEEVEDKDDSDHPKDKVYTRRSASKQNSLRVDSRRRHFSTDVSLVSLLSSLYISMWFYIYSENAKSYF